MSILSDVTIRSLCVAPPHIFDPNLHDHLVGLQNQEGWPLTAQAVERLRERIRQEAQRPLTEEEIALFKPMISPFSPMLIRQVGATDCQTKRKVISFGTTSYGYDVRLTDDVKIFTNVNAAEIDPKRFNQQGCLVDATVQMDEDGARFVRIPPNSYMLGSTVETFCIPRDIMVVCLGKSTYARCGAIVNTTPIEPGFEGNVVIEISNSTPLPIRVYLDEGIAQFLFFQGDRPCETSYADRGGKYQGQTGVTLPKV